MEHLVHCNLHMEHVSDVRRKTIYEYHRVSLKDSVGVKVADNSTIYFQALETCNRKKSCRDCLGDKLIKDLNVCYMYSIWLPMPFVSSQNLFGGVLPIY